MRLGDSDSDEMARRCMEAEEYLLDMVEGEIVPFTVAAEESIRAALAGEGEELVGADVGEVARRAGAAAWGVVAGALGVPAREVVRGAVMDAVGGVVVERLGRARRYLERVRAARAAYTQCLSSAAAREVRRRLDEVEECDEWLRLDPVDWDRVRAMLLPECDEKSFRRGVANLLDVWGRVLRMVLPEEYDEPARAAVATSAVPRTSQKTDVLVSRYQAGERLHAAGDPWDVADDEGICAIQSPGNGKKDARTVDGVVTEQRIIQIQGLAEESWSPDGEWGVPDWMKLPGLKSWRRLEIPPGRLESVMRVLDGEGYLWRAGQGERELELYCSDGSSQAALAELAGAGIHNCAIARARITLDVGVAADEAAPVARQPTGLEVTIEVQTEGGEELSGEVVDVSVVSAPVSVTNHSALAGAMVGIKRKNRRQKADEGWLPFDGC